MNYAVFYAPSIFRKELWLLNLAWFFTQERKIEKSQALLKVFSAAEHKKLN